MFSSFTGGAPSYLVLKRAFSAGKVVWAADGEDPGESKFLRGLLLAEVLLVLPGCCFFSKRFLAFAVRNLKGNILSGIWSRAEWWGKKNTHIFLSWYFRVDAESWSPYLRLLVKMYFQVTFKWHSDMLNFSECLPCCCVVSCCWCFISFRLSPCFCREVTGEEMETPGLFPLLSSRRLCHQPEGRPEAFQGRFGLCDV